jgi:FkbM family methyltransferase
MGHRLDVNVAYVEGELRDRAMQWLARLRGRPAREQLYQMSPHRSKVKLLGRAGTTDWRVFQQVFVEGEYALLDARDDVRCIVDCGANVGYTSAWLLSRYPAARCLAIEPDPANFQLMQRNLSQFGNRVAFLQAAVWSRDTKLKLVYDDTVGDWGTAGRECLAGETADVDGLSMESVLASAPSPEIDVLKLDVEGGETAVFSAAPERWLPQVKLCIVELHDDAARAALDGAIARVPFDVIVHGEIAAARRRVLP